jgi:pimeloyl-ACP methyl ester carboxylesterase
MENGETTSLLEKSFLLPLKNGYKVYTREVVAHNEDDGDDTSQRGGDKSNIKTIAAEVTIIVVHGGPGVGDASSELFQGLKDLPSTNLVVFFDQLGCGKSGKPSEEDAGRNNLYTLDGHVRQLEHVVEYYCRAGEDGPRMIGVLGHSWGGQIVLEWLTTIIKTDSDSVPPIEFAIVSNAPLDEEHYQRHQQELRNRLDEDVRTFYEEQDGILAKETTVGARIYQKLIGDSEVCINGEMKGWSVLDRIAGNNDLLVPCLFLVTRDDTVPAEDYRQIQTKLSSPHSVHIMGRGGHGPFFGPTAEEYKTKVKTFIEQTMMIEASNR